MSSEYRKLIEFLDERFGRIDRRFDRIEEQLTRAEASLEGLRGDLRVVGRSAVTTGRKPERGVRHLKVVR